MHIAIEREDNMKAKYTIALAMIGSFALGAAAVQGLHAQSKPPAYVIAEINVTDKDGYATSQGIAAGTSMLRLTRIVCSDMRASERSSVRA